MFRPTIPARTVRDVRTRAGNCCEVCGVEGTLAQKLEMHHLRYEAEDERGFTSGCIFGHETAGDLRLLCRSCHHAAHRDMNGDYWRDPQDMEDHWRAWNEEMTI